jgi:multisubunit Na+/H+ antiporter MnhE subunit
MTGSGHERVVAAVVDGPGLEPALRRARERAASADATLVVLCADEGALRRVRAELASSAADTEADATSATASVSVSPLGVEAILAAAGDDAAVLVAADAEVAVDELRDRGAGRSLTVEPVPLHARGRPRRLAWATGTPQRVALFGVAFGFYLLLGDVTAFDVATGAASALVVVALLDHVAFVESPTLGRTLPRIARAAAFLPWVVWEAVKANLAVAAVLLRPSLPIEPTIEVVETGAESDLERAVLANAITLTPGTLTVDVREDEFVVHTLTAGSRVGLLDGRVERAVRRVFGGRPDAASGGPGDEAGGRATVRSDPADGEGRR